jgi:hypothetical protein
MATEIKDIIQNVKDINMTDSSLDTLLNFERVLDELGLYAFENWKKGELVAGPIYEKYFVTCTFMWPLRLMPDPSGGERLLNYDCEVSYQKDMLKVPVKIKDPDDYVPGTKVAKFEEKPIWLVTIIMPKSLISEIRQGSVELEDEVIDLEDVDAAYEEGLPDQANQMPGAGEGVEGTFNAA